MRELLDRGEVAVCGPVAAELLVGAAVESELAERMREMLLSLPWAELDASGWCEVGEVASRLRHDGQSLPLTDLAIAVIALRAGHRLWSFDADFDRIVPVLGGPELYRPS